MNPCQPTFRRPLSPAETEALPPQSDFGVLGSGSNVERSEPRRASAQDQSLPQQDQPLPQTIRLGPAAAVAAGVLLAVLVGSVGTARAAWKHITVLFSANGNVVSESASDFAPRDLAQLDRLEPQRQAEALLERAVSESDGAVEQISSRLDRWQGKIKWDSEIANLTTAALSSRDLRVRRSGVEVELAAYGLAKNTDSLNYVLHTAKSRDHAKKIWALWSLGLLANCGVGTPVAVQTLTAHLKDSDQDSRRWAVAALAQLGSSQVISSLLRTMHDDPSPSVRQGAASSLAESGMLTREQRLAAVPQLLSDTEDPALDAQTRTWAFQALACITGQRLPNDSETWRLWYASGNTSARVN
jgi:HEAT repeat protein